MPKKPKIFICHSSANKEFVRDLVDRLAFDGIESWFDEIEIRIGESIHEKINEGLQQSDFVAVVLSKSSIKSKWVREELNSATSMEKYSEKGVFILPLLLDKCDVPPLLLDRRYANFWEDPESAYQELTESIYHHFKTKYPDTDVTSIAVPDVDAKFIEALAANPAALQSLTPRQFEELVADVFSNMGYQTSLTAASKDGGFDVIAQQPAPAGVAPQRILIECKRYSKPVGVEIVRSMLGVLTFANADRGIIVTTSTFTKGAKAAAEGQRLDLIDRENLLQWAQDMSDDSDPDEADDVERSS